MYKWTKVGRCKRQQKKLIWAEVGVFKRIYFYLDDPDPSGLQRTVNVFTGLLAKNAVESGLTVQPYLKTSLAPGSGVVTYYLQASGVIPYLEKLG